jgi:predicted NBD/HSP70 family sugar kinase
VKAMVLNNISEMLNYESRSIYNLIQKRGPITKSEMLDITKMKLSTLNRIIEPLEKNGLINAHSIGESSGGRKPILYDVNTKLNYVIGVDISRTYSKVAVIDMKMNILAQSGFMMTDKHDPETTVERIADTINKLLKELPILKSDICGIGVGAVGPLDRQKGIIHNPGRFSSSQWVEVHLKELMEQKTGLPVIIDNGANAAVKAEYLYGWGKGLSNIAYFNLGAGIRTGVIASGKLVRSINDTEDAFGHMVVDIDGKLCSCGNYGCIESYVSIDSILDNFIAKVKGGRETIISKAINEINYDDICIAAENGDEISKEIIINSAIVMGTGLANFINLLNPSLVVLSGYMILQSKLFYDNCCKIALKKHYAKENQVIFKKGGYFQDNSIVVGGANLVIESLINLEEI